MTAISDIAYGLTRELVGPEAVIPWWAWAAALIMIFWGLLGTGQNDG